MPSEIPYCDEAWNVITGCSPFSPGCENCYAACLAGGRLKHHPHYEGLADKGKWNGKWRFNRDILNHPRRWRKRRTILVCSTGDLFLGALIAKNIDEVIEMMRACARHRFLVLTKRAHLLEYFPGDDAPWPDNVWLGVSICNQKEADEKIPILLDTPAAHRWVSIEPMLGPVDVLPWLPPYGSTDSDHPACLEWVVIGCESGSHRRPCNVEWARDVVRQCDVAGIYTYVYAYVKQLDIDGKCSRDPSEWPEDLRVQQLPWGKEQ